jgi:proton-translocating NADH-quinone oxidoreductase chain N
MPAELTVSSLSLHNFISILPELVLCVTALLLLLEEMLAPRRVGLIAGTAILGCGLAFLSLGAAGLPGDLNPVQPSPDRLVMFGGFAADLFGILFRGVVILSTAIVVLMSLQYARRFRNPGEFFALVLFAALAASLLVGASDLVMLYLSLEFLSITSYVLVGYLKFQPRSTEAALKYFLFGAIAAAVMLYGLSLLYGLAQTTALYTTAAGLGIGPALVNAWNAGGADRVLLVLATTLTLVGFGFKAAVVPFHLWVPDVYDGAPTPVTAWLSVASKAAGFAAFVRLFAAALPVESWAPMVAILAAITMTVGNVIAIPQTNIKRMLAYSSIAHAGYVLIGLAAYGHFGLLTAGFGSGTDPIRNPQSAIRNLDWSLQATAIYMITYLFMNLGAFAIILQFYQTNRSHQIEGYAGLAQRSPGLAAMMTFFLLSLAGIPPTAGFFGKLMLFGAAIQANLIWLAIVGVVNAVISVYYYWNVVRHMYLLAPRTTSAVPIAPGVRAALALGILGTLGLFLLAQQLLALVNGRV